MKADRLEGLLDNYYHFIIDWWNGRCPGEKIDQAREAIMAYVASITRPERGRSMESAGASLARQVIAMYEIQAQLGAIGSPFTEPADVRLARAILDGHQASPNAANGSQGT